MTEHAAKAAPRRILVIKWSALGDVVIATAIMEDIARAFPKAEIHLNTLPNCVALFAHDPRFADVFAIDIRKKGARWRNTLAWLKRVRAGRYDLAIDLQNSDRSRLLLGLLALLPGAPRRRVGNRAGFPYTDGPAAVPADAHVFDKMRALLATLGVPARTEHPVFHAGQPSRARVSQLRREYGLEDGGYVVLLPGSQAGGRLKRWGTERYAELAQRLHRAGVARVVLVGGPDEVDVCRQIAAVGDFVLDLNGVPSLLEIAPLCAGAVAIIGNDTGTAHFAAGAGRPLLVLCGPTDPRRVKPIGGHALAVQAELPCRNCYGKTCAIADNHACMRAITPAWVAARLPALAAGELHPGMRWAEEGLRLY
ncbi:MAG: glycosyltransferase family 9 protein [Thiobacillus sp.]|nr:glycosyltransferase family 9 protein [Thiobacillus sp.]